MGRQATTKMDFLCPECGSMTPTQTTLFREKGLYHLKKLYCYYCKAMVLQIAVKDLDMLKARLEFQKDLSDQDKFVLECLNKSK